MYEPRYTITSQSIWRKHDDNDIQNEKGTGNEIQELYNC